LGDEWDPNRFHCVLGPIANSDSILDYGCGMGYNYQRPLVEAVERYVGADVSETALSNVREKGYEAAKIGEDSRVDFPDGTFGGAVAIEVMEHLFDPLAAAKELHRILKPGGVLVATVPNFGYHAWRLMALIRAKVPSEPEDGSVNKFNGVHIRYFNTRTFKQLFLDAGFSDVSIDSFDDSSIWDVFWALGPIGRISALARDRLPQWLRLVWLQNLMPSVFAYRIRAVARKAQDS